MDLDYTLHIQSSCLWHLGLFLHPCICHILQILHSIQQSRCLGMILSISGPLLPLTATIPIIHILHNPFQKSALSAFLIPKRTRRRQAGLRVHLLSALHSIPFSTSSVRIPIVASCDCVVGFPFFIFFFRAAERWLVRRSRTNGVGELVG